MASSNEITAVPLLLLKLLNPKGAVVRWMMWNSDADGSGDSASTGACSQLPTRGNSANKYRNWFTG